jgi:hypothetical protein
MIAVLGAGAMGAALAVRWATAGAEVALLGTDFDTPILAAVRNGRAHPALGVTLHPALTYRSSDDWESVLAEADVVVVALASVGLRDPVTTGARSARADATWVIATKAGLVLWRRPTKPRLELVDLASRPRWATNLHNLPRSPMRTMPGCGSRLAGSPVQHRIKAHRSPTSTDCLAKPEPADLAWFDHRTGATDSVIRAPVQLAYPVGSDHEACRSSW